MPPETCCASGVLALEISQVDTLTVERSNTFEAQAKSVIWQHVLPIM